jgi:NTE family protein
MATTKRRPGGAKAAARSRARGAPPPIDLALQGGGAHGAFTWGVLDRLLEDDELVFDGVSGTSAGAVNAAVMACGLVAGGRAGARAALDAFWHDVASHGRCFGQGTPWAADLAASAPVWPLPWPAEAHPFHAWAAQWLRLFSPYQWNPLGLDPLRDVLQRHVREADLQRSPVALFVTATSVRTGQARVFSAGELSVDALLASACLPQLSRAVHIAGEPFWDGGYSGNPALWPLIYRTSALDVVLVRVNPLQRLQLPKTAAEIADRVNEITFNAGLAGELRAIAFVHKLVSKGALDPGVYKDLRLHMVADEEGLSPLPPSSKLNTDRAFLLRLRTLGRGAAERWLQAHRDDLGRRSSLDVRATYLS